MGVSIDDKDYLSTIISSLPLVLSNFAAAQLAAPRMFSASKSIDPDVLISLLIEEADRQTAQQVHRRSSKKGTENEGDEALSAELKGRKGKGNMEVECWNCGEKGHFQRDCPKPKPSDEKDEGDSKAEATNTAESDSECEEAWCMEEDLVTVTSEVPMQGFGPISQISDVQDKDMASSNEAEEEEDWFLKAIEDANELVCQFSDVLERSMTAQVTNSNEN